MPEARLFEENRNVDGAQAPFFYNRPAGTEAVYMRLEAVHDLAEEVGGLLGIVGRGMGRGAIPGQTHGFHRPGQHGLTHGHTTQGRGVEAGEGMEGIAFHAAAGHGSVQEVQIEESIVAHQHGAVAAIFVQLRAYFPEQPPQDFPLRQGRAQRMVRVYARDGQGRWFEFAPSKGSTW